MLSPPIRAGRRTHKIQRPPQPTTNELASVGSEGWIVGPPQKHSPVCAYVCTRVPGEVGNSTTVPTIPIGS